MRTVTQQADPVSGGAVAVEETVRSVTAQQERRSGPDLRLLPPSDEAIPASLHLEVTAHVAQLFPRQAAAADGPDATVGGAGTATSTAAGAGAAAGGEAVLAASARLQSHVMASVAELLVEHITAHNAFASAVPDAFDHTDVLYESEDDAEEEDGEGDAAEGGENAFDFESEF